MPIRFNKKDKISCFRVYKLINRTHGPFSVQRLINGHAAKMGCKISHLRITITFFSANLVKNE